MTTRPNNYGLHSALSLDTLRSKINSEYYNYCAFMKTISSRCLIPNTMLYVCPFKQIFNSSGMLVRAEALVSKDSAHNLKDEMR